MAAIAPDQPKRRKKVVSAIQEIGQELHGELKSIQGELKSHVRRSITGDASVSVRSATQERVKNRVNKVREHLKKPKTIRIIDRMSFTIGILGIVVTQYVMNLHPTKFWMYYCTVIPTLIFIRYFMYKNDKMQYFLIDFCYFAQVLQIIDTFYPNDMLFGINFFFANGPIACAVVAWRNSLVFHSLDKTTSVFIHVFPLCLTYCNRWASARGSRDLDLNTFAAAIGMYLVWQVSYLFETEFRVKSKFDADKELSSSLRYLALKGHNLSSVRLVRRLLVGWRMMGKDEAFDPCSFKTKLVLVFGQLVFTIVTMLPCFLCYRNQHIHSIFAGVVMTWSVWNGATYYFEVFAGTYQHARERSGFSTPTAQSPPLQAASDSPQDGTPLQAEVGSNDPVLPEKAVQPLPASASVGAVAPTASSDDGLTNSSVSSKDENAAATVTAEATTPATADGTSQGAEAGEEAGK